MPRPRLGVFGGTFDPIHLGHVAVVRTVRDALDLDLVIVVPAGQPWLKASPPVASAEDRLAMTRLALADEPKTQVSRVDVDRPGSTYTVDTLRDLRAQHPRQGPDAPQWFFITGADALNTIGQWHQPDELIALAHLVGVQRPGHADPTPGIPDDAWSLVTMGPVDISSTDIRARVRAGEPIDHLVPAAVAAYIDEQRLYR